MVPRDLRGLIDDVEVLKEKEILALRFLEELELIHDLHQEFLDDIM